MLYICATPIGNLKDITYRAIEILSKADIILCEDTRNSIKLLKHYSINQAKLISLHQHNENLITQKVLQYLLQEKIIVQISDAGTPGISDPGARLCNAVLQSGYKISPLPGACAYISLLSVSGIDGPHLFYGFLPNTTNQRIKILQSFIDASTSIILYESPHRIIATLNDILHTFGASKEVVIGRELTKQFETIKKDEVQNIINFIHEDLNQQKGEFVLIISPSNKKIAISQEQENALKELIQYMPPKQATTFIAKHLGGDKNLLYKYLLQNKDL